MTSRGNAGALRSPVVPPSKYVRVTVGSEQVACIVCGTTTPHDLVVSGLAGIVRRSRPRSDLRHYSLCRTCGTKIPRGSATETIDLRD